MNFFFRHHVDDYACSQSLKMLALVRTLTFSFSAVDGFLSSYFTSDLNYNMSGLFGMTLWLLMPISWNVSRGSS